jgi:hypothetical protein
MTIDELFPEINSPDWISDREECWQLAMNEGDWKSEYRKKDLAKIKDYFFSGHYPKGVDITTYSGTMLKLFPIQTKAGYDYYYSTHDFTAEQLESNFSSAFLGQQSSGMRWQEQKAYYDYHVGDEFNPTKRFEVQGITKKIDVDAITWFKQISSAISGFLREDIYMPPEKLIHMLPYLVSAAEFILEIDGGFKRVKSRLLPKLITRIENDDYNHSGDTDEQYRKEIIEKVKPTYILIKENLSS